MFYWPDLQLLPNPKPITSRGDGITLTGFMETYLPEDEEGPGRPWNTWLPDMQSRLRENVCWGGNQECFLPKGKYLEKVLIKISFVLGSDLVIVSILHFLYVLILSDLKWNHILQVRPAIPLDQGSLDQKSLDQNFPLRILSFANHIQSLWYRAILPSPLSTSSPPFFLPPLSSPLPSSSYNL